MGALDKLKDAPSAQLSCTNVQYILTVQCFAMSCIIRHNDEQWIPKMNRMDAGRLQLKHARLCLFLNLLCQLQEFVYIIHSAGQRCMQNHQGNNKVDSD